MTKRHHHQQLPRSGPAREALRQKGQFWTPQWVADAMATYVLGAGATKVFDPAVGEGAFLRAVKVVATGMGRRVRLAGREVHAEALDQALASGLSSSDLKDVELRDFVLDPPAERFDAIIANPPYIRHHRIASEVKTRIRQFGAQVLGRPLDGRAGYHVYFLLRALIQLAPEGRLAFILPAGTFEGIFARQLWQWVARRYHIDAVVAFEPEASPFPGVDTNAIVVFIRQGVPQTSLIWCLCGSRGPELARWCEGGFDAEWRGPELTVTARPLGEALETGFSRAPRRTATYGARLGDYVKVMRGIATGANDFFLFSRKRAAELDIPEELLIKIVGRTRDVPGDCITSREFAVLEESERPCWLLSLDGRSLRAYPAAVRRYVETGVAAGLPEKALIAQRRPWYKMEKREVPDFLFAYLGRRNTRFIRNAAGVVPLTGFLCVYSRNPSADFKKRLWKVLSHPEVVANLALVGKSYGAGAIKVEPRALESLPLPRDVILEAGLLMPESSPQLAMI